MSTIAEVLSKRQTNVIELYRRTVHCIMQHKWRRQHSA